MPTDAPPAPPFAPPLAESVWRWSKDVPPPALLLLPVSPLPLLSRATPVPRPATRTVTAAVVITRARRWARTARPPATIRSTSRSSPSPSRSAARRSASEGLIGQPSLPSWCCSARRLDPQAGQRTGAGALDRPDRQAQGGRGVLLGQVAVVAQDDHRPLLRGQGGEDATQFVAGVRGGGVVWPSVAGRLGQNLGRPFPPPTAAGLVDVGVHEGAPGVGERGIDPPPLQVHLRQSCLHQILAAVVVAGQQAGGVQQSCAVRLDERTKARFVAHRPSRHCPASVVDEVTRRIGSRRRSARREPAAD